MCLCVRLCWLMFTCVCTRMAHSMWVQMCVLLEQLPSGDREVVVVWWGGGGDGGVAEQAAELNSASVPQDSLQLSARGHEKQSASSPGLTSAFNYRTQQHWQRQHRERLLLGHSQHVTAQTQRLHTGLTGPTSTLTGTEPRCFHTGDIQCQQSCNRDVTQSVCTCRLIICTIRL